MTDEYAELQKLRALWSKAMIKRDYIFIPLVMGIISVSLSQLSNFPPEWRFWFLVFEGLLLTFSALYWRKLSLKTDEDIVGLYGRMLELEKIQKLDTQTQYYYRHLKPEIREDINKKIDIALDNSNFSRFRTAANNKEVNHHYDLLLEKWNDLEFESVTKRGHDIHNGFAIGIVVGYWVIFAALWLSYPESITVELPTIP